MTNKIKVLISSPNNGPLEDKEFTVNDVLFTSDDIIETVAMAADERNFSMGVSSPEDDEDKKTFSFITYTAHKDVERAKALMNVIDEYLGKNRV